MFYWISLCHQFICVNNVDYYVEKETINIHLFGSFD